MRGGAKMTLPELIDAMEEAGTTDLRGHADLPLALRVIGKPKDPEPPRHAPCQAAWLAAGAHRIDRNRDGRYDDADAIRSSTRGGRGSCRRCSSRCMGDAAVDALEDTYAIDNAPNNHGDHLGSAYQAGFYGYVKKDLERC